MDQTPNATDEEKVAAKAKVDEAVTTAKNAIDQATNNNGVDTAKTNGVDAINNVQPTETLLTYIGSVFLCCGTSVAKLWQQK
nr:DUF1542 domain-containing protein [Staphylococcus haemolyticus]